jgi:hypothetical protein
MALGVLRIFTIFNALRELDERSGMSPIGPETFFHVGKEVRADSRQRYNKPVTPFRRARWRN